MTNEQRKARIEALEEAALHLGDMDWTEDREEWAQGRVLAERWRREAVRLQRTVSRKEPADVTA
jgi:hypothetical protein